MANNNISFKPRKSQLDGVISGATLDNGVLILSRTQGLINVEVNLSGLTGSSGSLNTFNNGLTDNNGIISLGGTLTGNTVIDTGGNGIAFGSNSISCGNNSFAEGSQTTASGNASHAEGRSTTASGNYSHAEGFSTIASGNTSHAEGYCTTASGFNSHAGGYGAYNKEINSNGVASFNHSYNSGSQILGHGAIADQSVILGGINHNIEAGNTRAAIIGGDTIKLTGTDYIDTTAVSNLAIMSSPSTGTSGDTVLVRDSSTGIIKQVAQASLGSQGEDNNLLNITGVTTYTADGNNYVLLVDTSSAGQTITLPASPVDGLSYKIKDKSGNASVNNVTIDGNGSNIDGAANASINTNFGAFELVYSSDDTAWFTLSFVN